jgi:hypothetical protein
MASWVDIMGGGIEVVVGFQGVLVVPDGIPDSGEIVIVDLIVPSFRDVGEGDVLELAITHPERKVRRIIESISLLKWLDSIIHHLY